MNLNICLDFLATTIPMRGTASDVVGIDSATKFKNTVNDRRIVTPAKCLHPFSDYLKRFISFCTRVFAINIM